MHILVAVLSVLGVVVSLIIRAGMIARAGRELGDAASTMAGAARRASFRRKTERPALTQLEDPREAVAALMVAIAKVKGDLTESQLGNLERLIETRLDFSPPSELLTHARWLTSETVEPGAVLHRVSRYIAQGCTDEQKHDIVDILTLVALFGGEPDPLQLATINQLKGKLGLKNSPGG